MTGTATESAELQVHRDAGIWFARLNRPEKRNALSDALVAALGATCERVAPTSRLAHSSCMARAGTSAPAPTSPASCR